jgi:hypothetical protein
MNTYFDSLETLLIKNRRSPTEAADNGLVAVTRVREAMIKDQHRLFHDGEFHAGCKICDEERKNNQ